MSAPITPAEQMVIQAAQALKDWYADYGVAQDAHLSRDHAELWRRVRWVVATCQNEDRSA